MSIRAVAARWTPVLLLALALAPATSSAQQAPPPLPETAQRTIRVSGVGEARAAPDEARIELAVETMAPTAREAGEAIVRSMERTIAALTRAGVPRRDIETRGYSIFPDYREPRPGDTVPQIRGYRAANTVSVRTDRLDRVGTLIDVALGAGANRLNGVAFSLRDAAPAQEAALRDATAKARRSAETIAAALGVRLGAVLDASTSASPPRWEQPMMMRVRDFGGVAESGGPTPIQPGEQTVGAVVSLVFAIDR
jgi:uncharacterized protein YggE